MTRITRILISTFTAIALFLCSYTSITASAATPVTNRFDPIGTMYTTSTGTFYSDPRPFGHSNQVVSCTFEFAVNVPKDTNSGYLVVQGVLQRKTSTGWIDVKELSTMINLYNSSSSQAKYVVGTATGQTNVLKDSTYRAKFNVIHYTGSAQYQIVGTHFEFKYTMG